jgi:uridine kinase
MSEKSIKLSHEDESWQLRLHRGEKGHFAMLESVEEAVSVTTRLSRAAFGYYENTVHPLCEQSEELDHKLIVNETKAALEDDPFVIGITGRSGSGKSTLTKKVEREYRDDGFSVTVLSTDDYNRGKKEIHKLMGIDHENGEKINWDSHVVYDMEGLHWDLQRAKMWIPTLGLRKFDFASCEPIKTQEFIHPAQIIIVEGIMANSPVIRGDMDRHYSMSTPLATCIGRRVLRDVRGADRQIAWTSEEILKYQLEMAEPEYRKRIR